MASRRCSCVALLLLLLCLLGCKQQVRNLDKESLGRLGMRAYEMRYRDVDQVEKLSMEAFRRSGGRDEMAQLNLAYVAYQRMDFDRVEQLLNHLRKTTNNQIFLLCADVMDMKATQRTNNYASFFQAMYDARKRMKRIDEERADLTPQQERMYLYAYSEFHITASTYYYYQKRDSLSVSHIREVGEKYLNVSDTAQWVYYNYIMGSGGMVDAADKEAITLAEFDYLLKAYRQGRQQGYIYFEANALQSLASMVLEHYDLIANDRNEQLQVIEMQMHASGANELSLAMCQRAIELFQTYKDVFQTACCYRTMGQLLFSQQRYSEALEQYRKALELVNLHHTTYYHRADTLVLYDSLNLDHSTEAEWLRDVTVQTVPDWIAGIREQISKTYSALGMKSASDYNRNAYLDILELTDQNEELELRREELMRERRHLMLRAGISLLLFLVLVVLLIRYRRRASRYVAELNRQLADVQSGTFVAGSVKQLQEELEELEEQVAATTLQLEKNKQQNVVGRARVSLVHAIVPYLDRIAGEVQRVKREGVVREERRTYILELVNQISEYNDVLTEWIKVRQGQLALNIRTVELSRLFQIVAEGRVAFEQKGVKLYVEPTGLCVKADEALTLFMINTLADNARKFTSEQGIVSISAKDVDNCVEVSVSDTGVGLTEADLEMLNHNQVYDPSVIGTANFEQKGFGFGLANCRGIIEKYKKHSELFHCCRFGVYNNQNGKGCTFFFRLPRVLMLIALFLLPMSVSYATTEEFSGEQLYDSVYQCNLRADYETALSYGDRALRSASLSPQLEMGICNEMALAALAQREWDLYDHYNARYTQLQKQLNQDNSLPEYVDKLESYHRSARLMLLCIAIIMVAVLWIVYKLAINRRLETGKDVQARISDYIACQEAELRERIARLNDRVKRNAYEQNRIYVQNQVLSNCLSTIKHESMYYPSRIANLVRNLQQADVEMLDETVSYYRNIYSILCRQADDQVAQPGFKRQRIAARDVAESMVCSLRSQVHKRGEEPDVIVTCGEYDVCGDSILLDYFCQQVAQAVSGQSRSFVFSAESDGRFVTFVLTVQGVGLADEALSQMFSPSVENLPLYIARQIIREHDTYSGNPGLRLLAQPCENGYTITFTLKENL